MIDTLEAARALQNDVVDLRRAIHAEPELGNELPATTAKVEAALAGLPLDIRRSASSTSLVATLSGGKSGKRILLRADMDALPMPEDNDLPFASRTAGRMHACGHDSHTAMLVGAAKLLCQHQDNLAGTVDFFFQTGEEGHFGAKVVLDEGLFEAPNEPDAVFALHIAPLLDVGKVIGRPGTMMAAADTWEIVVRGKGGHASMPHDCLDPIPVACEIVQSLQTFTTRRINPFDPVILTCTKIEAGTTTNVIPETAHLTGTLRSTSERARSTAHEGIRRVAKKIGEAYEMEVDVDISLGYPVTVNNPEFVKFAQQTTENLLGKGGYREVRAPMMGAEDFSYLLQRWPGAMFFLGVKPEDPALAAPCHSNRMLLNEDGMVYGAALHAQIALDFLNA